MMYTSVGQISKFKICRVYIFVEIIMYYLPFLRYLILCRCDHALPSCYIALCISMISIMYVSNGKEKYVILTCATRGAGD